MTTLAQVAADATAAGTRLLRAVPRGEGRLLVTLRDEAGVEVAGQWYADPDRCREVARRTRAVAPRHVSEHGGRLLVQRGGADRRLPQLRQLLSLGGTLVAHRPERRGVLRRPDGRYTKVVPAARVAGIADTLRLAATWAGVRVPDVVEQAPGAVTLEALPGATLHALLAAPDLDHGAVGRAVGAALARLHTVPVPAHLARHTLVDEVEVTERWLRAAAAHAGLPGDVVASLDDVRLSLVHPAGPAHPVVLHRDLHDKQILIDGDRVGVLDLDLLAAGDPALDLANLLVHLELRVLQGVLPHARAHEVARGVLDGYDPTDEVLAGLPLHARLSRSRLAGVYAFRPAGAAAALLLADPASQRRLLAPAAP